MTKEEIKKVIESVNENKSLIKSVEDKYGQIPNITVKKVISYTENDMFIGQWRVISKQEILNSTEEIHVDFVEERIVPVFDIGDNDFICYSLVTNKWVCYNIIDKLIFDEREELFEYLAN